MLGTMRSMVIRYALYRVKSQSTTLRESYVVLDSLIEGDIHQGVMITSLRRARLSTYLIWWGGFGPEVGLRMQ